MSGGQEDIAAEEGIIIRGCVTVFTTRSGMRSNVSCSPQSRDLRAYTDAIDRLNASFAFKESGEDSTRTVRVRISCAGFDLNVS